MRALSTFTLLMIAVVVSSSRISTTEKLTTSQKPTTTMKEMTTEKLTTSQKPTTTMKEMTTEKQTTSQESTITMKMTTSKKPSTAVPHCPFVVNPDSPYKFQTKHEPIISLYCPSGLIFKNEKCACDWPGQPGVLGDFVHPVPDCDNSCQLYLKFEHNLKDSSCNMIFVEDSGVNPVGFSEPHEKNGKALQLRSGNMLNIAYYNNKFLGNNNSISIGFLLKIEEDHIDTNILYYGCDHENLGFSVDYWSSRGVVAKINSNLGGSVELEGGSLGKGDKAFVAIVFDQEVAKLYIDGNVVDSEELVGGLQNAPCDLKVQKSGDGWIDIDNLKIFQKAISDDEVNALIH